MMFHLRVSIGAALVGFCALGAGAAPPRAPKAMPTPAPEAVNPDEPPNDEVVKLLMDPNARGTGPAFSAARAVALARGDDRKWHQLLRREALSAFDNRASNEAAVSAARESLIRRIEADRPRKASLEVDIAFSLVLAELQPRRPDPRDSYAAVFALRDRLGAKPRETLPFVCPQQTGDWHPTSRDVVSHLYAAVLTGVPRRPLRGATELLRLLGPLPKGPDAEASAPAKACAVLDDLERWHLSVKSPVLNHRAGALQARLERSRILSQWFPLRDDQALIVASLRELLPAYRGDAAWAEGMAQLSLLVNQSAERPEDPLAIAEEGARAYPESPGALRCSAIARALRLEIDDPALELPPERGGQPLGSALSVSHGRAASLRFRAFPEPADLECVARAQPGAGPSEVSGESAIEWTAKLQEPVAGERATTSIPLPLPRKGLYRLQFGREGSPLREPAVPVLVTDIALLTRRRDRAVEVWTVDAASGAPVHDAEVRLFLRGGAAEPVSTTVSQSSTDVHGRAVFDLPGVGTGELQFLVVARRGQDLASAYVGPDKGRHPKTAPANSTDSKAPIPALSLDRPNGAAGEIVRWRAGLYCPVGAWSEGLFRPVSGATLTLSLRDGTDGAGGTLEPLSTQEVSSGPYGEASGEIVLPKLAEGSGKGWIFELTAKAPCGEAAASVTNTARTSVGVPPRIGPTGIEIALTHPTLVSGVPTRLEGVASRAGLPLPNAQVTWEITAPRIAIRRAESREGSRMDRSPWGRVAEGILSTDSQGRFSIPVVGPATHGDRDAFDGLLVRVDLRSVEGETATVRHNLTALPGTVTLNLSGPTVYRQGEQIVMRVSRRGALSGMPSPGESVAKVQRISKFEPTWVPGTLGSWSYGGPRGTARALEDAASGVDVREERVTSDATGEARLSMRLDPGFYRLVVTTVDEEARKTQATRAFVVDGPSLRVPVPLALLEDDRRPGPSRIFTKGSGDQVVVEISRVGAPVERKFVAANGDGVLEVSAPANETVNVMAYTVRDGRLLGYDSVLQRRDERLVLSLDAASPSLEVRASTRDGTPVPGVALHVVAVPRGSDLRLRDPFHRDSAYPVSSHRPQFSTLAQYRPVSLPGATSSEWYRAEIPEPPSERSPLHSDTSSRGCGLGSQTTTRLARRDPSVFGYDLRSSSFAVDARRHDPAAVWAPGLITDARGVVRTPFLADPGTAYVIHATAIAQDGRTGYLGQLVLPRDELVPTSVSR